MQGLIHQFVAKGGVIYENTRITEMQDGKPCTVKTEDGAMIMADNVICATHTRCNQFFYAENCLPIVHMSLACAPDNQPAAPGIS